MNMVEMEYKAAMDKISAGGVMGLAQIVENEYRLWTASAGYDAMLQAESYYRNRSQVQLKTNRFKKRSNTKLEHPILRKLVDQKTNYLLSNTWSITAENKNYAAALNKIFNDKARQAVKAWGKESIKKGIGWVQLYFEDNRLCMKKLPSEQIIPLWKDEEHTVLDGLIRFYNQWVYKGREKQRLVRLEYWDRQGVRYFTLTPGGQIKQELEKGGIRSHFEINGRPYNWQAPPFLWVKYNEEELPLLHFIKELIDDINWQSSVTADVLRDVSNFIYVLKNYGGEDLNEFVKNLQQALAIKFDGDGEVQKLNADLNIDAAVKLIEMHRRDIYDYARSVDTQDPNLGNASGLALQFRYADLDMDANDLECEFQLAFENMKPFLDTYLKAAGIGEFSKEDFEVCFNRDVIINESERIENAVKSAEILSGDTILKNHPWVEDPQKERQQKENGNCIQETEDMLE